MKNTENLQADFKRLERMFRVRKLLKPFGIDYITKEIDEYLDYLAFLRIDEEKQLKKEINDWARQQPEYKIALSKRIKEKKEKEDRASRERGELYAKSYKENWPEWLRETIILLAKPKEKKKNTINFDKEVSIEEAKNYPIENLIEIDSRGFAKCIWHNDHNPSMYCKNNFAHCFSCGKSGSVIDVYMQLNNCDFKTALKELQ